MPEVHYVGEVTEVLRQEPRQSHGPMLALCAAKHKYYGLCICCREFVAQLSDNTRPHSLELIVICDIIEVGIVVADVVCVLPRRPEATRIHHDDFALGPACQN